MSYYDTHDHHGYATTDDLDDLRRQLDQVRYDADRATDDLGGDLDAASAPFRPASMGWREPSRY
jgi:hypothetical protein